VLSIWTKQMVIFGAILTVIGVLLNVLAFFGSCPKSVIGDKSFSINELWVPRRTTGLP
jgi:hypothetical protein